MNRIFIGFKKEQLRVQINNYGVLTISGEQPTSDAKINRFRKEIKISRDLNPAQIRARFVRGILYITMQYGSSQVKESTKTQKNEKNQNNTCGSGSCVGDDNMLRVEISKKIAASVAVVIALGTVVGGFLIAWNYSKVPAPITY